MHCFCRVIQINSDMKTEKDDIGSTMRFLQFIGVDGPLPNSDATATHDFYSHLILGLLKLRHLRRAHVSCLLSVNPSVATPYGTLQGGAVAAVAETIAFATARSVVREDKELFLGDFSISYLSAAPLHAKLIVEGDVVRSGRNITVVGVEFKLEQTGKLVYTARATFFNTPLAKL